LSSDLAGQAETGPLWRAMIASVVLLLPNLAGAGLLFGMGVPATGSIGGSFGIYGDSTGVSVSILDVIDRDQRFWIWPLVTLVLLALTGVSSARRSPGHWLALVLPVALFVLALNVSAGWSGTGAGFGLGGSAGFDYLLTIVLGAVYGFLAGLLGAALTRRRAAVGRAAVATAYPPVRPVVAPPPYPPPPYPPPPYPPPAYPPAYSPPPAWAPPVDPPGSTWTSFVSQAPSTPADDLTVPVDPARSGATATDRDPPRTESNPPSGARSVAPPSPSTSE
jgi:hypothetical protein